MTSATVDRRLIPIEQSKEILNRMLGASNVLLASKIEGPLTPDVLRRGLDLLQGRHPRLRSIIEGPGSDLVFKDESAAPIPLRLEEVDGEAGAHAIELEELNRPLDSASCLVRVTLLQPANPGEPRRLLLLSHHAIADGHSLLELLEDLVSFCGRLCAGETIAAAELESLPLLPSAHDLMPADMKTLRGRVENWAYGRRTRARVRGFGARTLPAEASVPLAARRSGVVKRLLAPELLARLRERWAASGISPHGALCAALLFAVAGRLPPLDSESLPLLCRSSVSLRQKIEPPVGRKDLGLLASFLLSFHRLGPDTTVDGLAAEVLEQVWRGYHDRDMFRGLLANRRNTESALAGRVPVSVFVTNLDEAKIRLDHGPLNIGEIFGLPGGAAFAGVVGLASLVLNGSLALGFFFSEPALSVGSVEAIADDVERCLELASRGDLRFAEFRDRE